MTSKQSSFSLTTKAETAIKKLTPLTNRNRESLLPVLLIQKVTPNKYIQTQLKEFVKLVLENQSVMWIVMKKFKVKMKWDDARDVDEMEMMDSILRADIHTTPEQREKLRFDYGWLPRHTYPADIPYNEDLNIKRCKICVCEEATTRCDKCLYKLCYSCSLSHTHWFTHWLVWCLLCLWCGFVFFGFSVFFRGFSVLVVFFTLIGPVDFIYLSISPTRVNLPSVLGSPFCFWCRELNLQI